jgi:CRP-like cAMP-binding protein
MPHAAPPNPHSNRLLAALSQDVRERLLPNLELVRMRCGKSLYESGDELSHVYFPINSIISVHYVTENGKAAEISVVGCEGVVGAALCMGGEGTPSRAVVLFAGQACRLHKRHTTREFNAEGELRDLMLRYTQVLLTQTAQTAVCNRHHTIDQQLCRWLLTQLDRLSGNDLVVTQEVIATMLGVRREGVTEAAGRLQRLNVISYRRGRITVLDRPALENLSCECYAVVKKETDRLLPYAVGMC